MITNDRQMRITRGELLKFEDALSDFSAQGIAENADDELFRQIQIDAMTSQLDELRSELAAYEATKSGQVAVLELDSLDQLPDALIAARIASQMTQEDLAKRIGVHEQQIQRYEASRYASASMTRLKEVVEALGVGIREDVLLPTPTATPRTLFTRLAEVGIGKEMVIQRLVPAQVRAELESIDDEAGRQASLAMQAASAVGRVYGLLPSAIFGPDRLRISAESTGAARFSARANANERRLIAYTVYARYLARLVLKSTPELNPAQVPTDPLEFRSRVVQAYGAFGFEQVLRFAWDLGIAVVPLNDPGAFHAAFWRIEGRNVIVLNQRGEFASRSFVDLLHEIGHAGEEPAVAELSVIEEGDSLRHRKSTKGERRAVHFSVTSALNGRQEDLAYVCYKAARNRVELLTSVVPRIAAEEAVDVGILADYLAWRMQFEQPPVDWWPAATNLQPRSRGSWQVARAVLLKRVDLTQVNGFDRDLLTRALSETEEIVNVR